MGNQIDIILDTQVEGSAVVEKLLEQLREIEKLSSVNLKVPQKSRGGGSSGSGGSSTNDAEKEEIALLKQKLDMEKNISTARTQGLTESMTKIKEYQNSLDNNILLTELQVKELQTLMSVERDRVSWEEKRTQQDQKMINDKIALEEKMAKQEEQATTKQIALEQRRLNQLNELRRAVEGSDIANKSQVTKDLYVLEKRLAIDNWENELKLVKEDFSARVKYEKEFRALEKSEEEKATKLRLEEEKRIQSQKIAFAEQLNKSQFERSPEIAQMKSYYEEFSKVTENLAKDQEQAIKINDKMNETAYNKKIALEKAQYQATKQNNKMEAKAREDLEKIKLSLIKTNMYQTYKAEVELLEKKKNLSYQEVKIFKKRMDEVNAYAQGRKADFTQALSGFMQMRSAMSDITRSVKTMAELEDAVYQTGIVAGRSAVEIQGMRQELFALGSEIPRLTKDIIENVTAVQRTGQSYEDAMTIVKQSAKLAVTAGESITMSTDVLNKALIAFDIGAENTKQVMDIFHSASANTPLDLKKISDGMKNSASSMRNFIESTSKSGKELDDYKLKLLELNTAMLGNQSAMARQASSSGLSIRTLTTKLTILEKTAREMFDAEMKLNGVMIKNNEIVRDGSGGIQLTSEALSQLAQDDLPRAVELLSELYKTGEIGRDTLTKMFTGRQSPALMAQLALINGNLDTYISKTTQGRDVNKDFEQSIQSWSEQMKIAQNNITRTNAFVSEFMDIIGVVGVKAFNGLIDGMNDFLSSTDNTTLAVKGLLDALVILTTVTMLSRVTKLTSALNSIGTMEKGVSLTHIMKNLLTQGNIIVGVVAGIVALVAGLYSYQQRIIKRNAEISAEHERQLSLINKQLDALNTQQVLLDETKKQLEDLSKVDLTKEWEKGVNLLDSMTGKFKDILAIIEATQKVSVFNLPELKSASILFNETFDIIKKGYLSDLESMKNDNDEFKKLQTDKLKNINKYEKAKTELSAKSQKILDVLTDKESELYKNELNIKLNQEKYYNNLIKKERENLESETNKLLEKESKNYRMFKLQDVKVATDANNEIFKLNKDMSFWSQISGIKTVSLTDIMKTNDIESVKSLLKEMYDTQKLTESQYLAGMDYMEKRYQVEIENIEAVNKALITYQNNTNNVTKAILQARANIFTGMLESKNFKNLDDFKNYLIDIGAYSENMGASIDNLQKSLTHIGSKLTLDELTKNNKLIEATGVVDYYSQAIQNAETAIKNLEIAKTTEGVKGNDKLTQSIDNEIEAQKENIKQLKENMDLNLKAYEVEKEIFAKRTLFQDTRLADLADINAWEKKGLELIKARRDALVEESRLSKEKYDFEKSNLVESIVLKEADLKLDQESLLFRKNQLESAGQIGELTESEAKLLENINALLNLNLERDRQTNAEYLKRLGYIKDERDYYDEIANIKSEMLVSEKNTTIEKLKQQKVNLETELMKEVGKENADYIKIINLQNKIKDKGNEIAKEQLGLLNSAIDRDTEINKIANSRQKIMNAVLNLTKILSDEGIKNAKLDEKQAKDGLAMEVEKLKNIEAYNAEKGIVNETDKEWQDQNLAVLKSENDVQQSNLNTQKAKIDYAKQYNKLLMDSLGIVTQLISATGEEGALIGSAINQISSLFTENEAGLNAFQQMAQGGVASIYSTMSIGLTAYEIGNAFWEHQQAKKQAEHQKRIEFMDKERNKILKSQSSVFSNALSNLDFTQVNEAFITALRNYGVSSFNTKIQAPKDASWLDFFSSGKSQEGGFDFSYDSVKSIEDLKALQKEFNNVKITSTKTSYVLSNLTEKQKAQIKTLADVRAFKQARDYINELVKVYEENKDKMFSTQFGFNIEAEYDPKDTEKIIGYTVKGWEKASSIIEKIQSNALEGLNDINSYIGSDFVSTVSNAFISGNQVIQNSIDNLETGYATLSNNIMNGLEAGLSLKQIFEGKAITWGGITDSQALTTLKGMVAEAKNLETEQTKVNEDVNYLRDLWISLGGDIADISSLLDDMDNGILDALAQGLLSRDSETLIADFGQLMTDTLRDTLKNSDIMNVPFKAFSGAIEDALASSDTATFERIYRDITDASKELNAEDFKRLGMTDEQITKLQTMQEIYTIINKIEEESLTIIERRDKLLSEAQTAFENIIGHSKAYYKIASKFNGGTNEWNEALAEIEDKIKNANLLTQQIATNSNAFIQDWVKGGRNISDVLDMMTDEMKTLYDSTLDFLNADNYADASSQLGENLATNLIDSWQEKLMNEMYSSQFLELYSKYSQAMSSGTLGDIQALNNEVQKLAVQTEQERLRFSAIKDLFNLNKEINFADNNQTVTYETGTTKSNVYNYYNTVDITGTFIADKTSMRTLADELVKYMPDSLKSVNAR